jgi:hypothetical protein
MERKEMLDILKSMCERCLMKGLIQTLDEAKELYEVFDRFCNSNYINDEEYSRDIFYLYNLAKKLHISGNTSLEESYSIYNAILTADRVDFVETKEPNIEQTIVNVEPVILKRSDKSEKVKDGVVDISDITPIS